MKVYGMPEEFWNEVVMDKHETKLFLIKQILALISIAVFFLVVYPMTHIPFYAPNSSEFEKTVLGFIGFLVAATFTTATCKAFYNKRSSWRELSLEFVSVVGISIGLVIITPYRNPFPGIPDAFISALTLTMYIVAVAAGTNFIEKEESLNSKWERRLWYSIRLVGTVFLFLVTSSLALYFFWGNSKGMAVLGLTVILAYFSFIYYTDYQSGKFQLTCHILNLTLVPLLQFYASPSAGATGIYWFLQKAIMPALYIISVVTTVTMYRDLSEDALDIIEGLEEEKPKVPAEAAPVPAGHPPTPAQSAKPMDLKKGDKFLHPEKGVELTVTGPPFASSDEDGVYIGVPCTDGKKEAGVLQFEPQERVTKL